MQRFVVVTIQVEGVHQWPGCDIKEVAFLKHPHRHVFHIKCTKHVEGDDREIEIIAFKRQIVKWLYNVFGRYEGTCVDFAGQSCEMIAETLTNEFGLYACQVLEDGENGAVVINDDPTRKEDGEEPK